MAFRSPHRGFWIPGHNCAILPRSNLLSRLHRRAPFRKRAIRILDPNPSPGCRVFIKPPRSLFNLAFLIVAQFAVATFLFSVSCWRYTRLTRQVSPCRFSPLSTFRSPTYTALTPPISPTTTRAPARPLPFPTRPYFAPLLWKSWSETRLTFALALLAVIFVSAALTFLLNSLIDFNLASIHMLHQIFPNSILLSNLA